MLHVTNTEGMKFCTFSESWKPNSIKKCYTQRQFHYLPTISLADHNLTRVIFYFLNYSFTFVGPMNGTAYKALIFQIPHQLKSGFFREADMVIVFSIILYSPSISQASCDVHQSFSHLSSPKHFITAMESLESI